MSETEVKLDMSKSRVHQTIALIMEVGESNEPTTSYEIAQAISEVFLGMLVMANVIEMPASAFDGIRKIVETKDVEGFSVIDRVSNSLKQQIS